MLKIRDRAPLSDVLSVQSDDLVWCFFFWGGGGGQLTPIYHDVKRLQIKSSY